jgi:putative inorganic carbon (HCO3(-)) transporter
MGFGFACLVALIFRPKLVTAGVAVGLAALLLLAVIIVGPEQDRILVLADRPQTTQERIDQIVQGADMIGEHPLFGVGLGNFEDLNRYSRHRPNFIIGEQRVYRIHNTSWWILTEFGLVGLVIFACFIGWFFVEGAAVYRRAPPEHAQIVLGLMCAHAGMLGLSFGIESLYQRHWWFAMALIGSARVITRTAQGASRALESHRLTGQAPARYFARHTA